MKIIFFGSSEFSLPMVKKISEHFELIGVVVTPAKPQGRGLKITVPEVATWANQVGIAVFSPDDPNADIFVKTVATLNPDLYALSAYGYILSGDMLAVPRLGGINIHPSLLPKYRGAAPIQRAIMAGEKKTGITIFFMDEKIDHGKIIFQRELAIEPHETHGSLLARLSQLGSEMIVDVVRSIETGNYQTINQNDQEKTYAPKVKKEEMTINWQLGAERIFNLIRALSPKPGARTSFRGKELIIIQAVPSDKKFDIGLIYIENKNIYVGTGDGSIILKELKPEGRSKISGLDFINGFRIKEGEQIA